MVEKQIKLTKFALNLIETHNISKEEAARITKSIHVEDKKITTEDEKQIQLNVEKLKLLKAEAAQDSAAIHEAQKQLNLEQSIQDIMHSTNVDRQTAINLAKELSAVDAGADTNQSGFVTAKEQRAEESRQRKLAQERRKREREERAAEVGADEKQRQAERNAQMSGREMANGLITGAEGNQMPSGEIAPSIKTQENAVVEINKQTAENTKEILLEMIG